MELDCHYYTVYQLAKLAGFNLGDAETIAYASQYVDDSTESNPVEPFPHQHFDTARTAHYGLKAFNWNVQKKVYMPFLHFLPMKIRWESLKDFSYVTQRATGNDNELATMLIKDALTETNRRFKLIYSFLKTAKAPLITSADLAHDYPNEFKTIQSLFTRGGNRDSRCKRWKKYTNAPEYDKKKWRRGALKGNVD
jgi:hypothetical protein